MRSIMLKIVILSVVVFVMIMSMGCARTTKIAYPADKFVTVGDDPGSESEKPYIPKGYLIITETEWYPPLPILGVSVFGNADPIKVFNERVLPLITEMGGDALIGI